LPVTVSKKSTMRQKNGEGLNVIGYLPGEDPVLKYEYIIVGAHYDHLGYGEVGSRTGNEIIHPGADDNASGVAGVLELAEYFKQNGGNKRTIIFQLYSGEEVGLIGANAWASDFEKKLVNTSAMINMDMIGRVRDGKVTIFCTSTSTAWDGIIDRIQAPGLTFAKVPTVAANSDHAPFARRQVPSVFWHSNLTDEYHTERDTIETLNMPGMVKVLESVKQMIKLVDAKPTKLAWNPDAQMAQRRGTARGVTIGFMPNMTAAGPGVVLAGVTPNSPAARAGLKEGDRIMEMGGRKLNSLEDMQAAFQGLRAGVAVTLIVQRGTETLTIQVTPTGG
ncbi:MAG: M20/M25/M40 family metallo-hydrolase, partial [Fimbriimonadaceae bacterium]|nr:M20/M25/M40 family metallo-hydrolase [Fimbriimonadaceae bacterium]